MKHKILIVILTVSKWIGLFSLARKFTASDLRILCYHGAEILDESQFRPGLFIAPSTFARRMRYLRDAGYNVISLDDALYRRSEGTLPNLATVITIDDGWYGTYRYQAQVLNEYGFPATLYISTYYIENQMPVFNVALSYVLWKNGQHGYDLSVIRRILPGLEWESERVSSAELYSLVYEFGEKLDSAAARHELLRTVCQVLEVDWRQIESQRLISFMSEVEAGELARSGVDIQLHTHRHCFPDDDFARAKREIEDNRQVLKKIADCDLRHFCYPSGVYSERSIEFLKRLGIVSATTTDPGFNSDKSPEYELTRFLDSENVTDLEFEAELTGFFELIRKVGYRI